MSLMIPKKQKSILLSSNVIFYIVGKKRLQNELIASYLYHKTDNECLIFENIKNIPKNHKRLIFVFWECKKKDLDDMMIELRVYNAQENSNNHIVLFDVPANLKFQKKIIFKGIHGFFYEHDSLDNLIKGIQAILNGKLWFPREMMARCIFEGAQNGQPAKSAVEKLTRRQVEILSMIAVGATNQEISKKLYISPHTVKNHLYNIFKKTNVSNRIQASLWAANNL